MPWWSWRSGHANAEETSTRSRSGADSGVRLGPPAPRVPEQSVRPAAELGPTRPAGLPCPVPVPAAASGKEMSSQVAPVTLRRVGDALDLLDIRYLADGDGSLLAMWERHAVLFTLEGPDDEILVVRARPHSTVPPDWADRAYRVVNEWNHTRRFCKAYVGDPTDRGQLPIYAELQVPLAAGAHDALLVEVLDCGAAVATTFVDWLHDEGALL
ncbi:MULTISPECIES: YbjN domain-containing protein [unclassified Solwaraspora]|uniref:YbjN domain-containing protein n=1 Tax=unclassified Solwaraspora TaxID=2627926 RepID=UPI00259B6411|nr:YbjN domain-containing protein [Solwaraspora sp. WMMA2056]WJK43122.1 YbjN domain-containing protein [Solwaraspora sp. WMMA2056]